MTRVAAIDCGTNSIRLLVADVVGETLVDVSRRMIVVRLGEGVDRTGEFSSAAIGRTLDALRDYTDELRVLGAERVRMVATSAARDAANSADFLDAATEVLGVRPEIISGDEEARLSFLGATRGLPADAGNGAPFLVVDIGGGSTEFVLGTDEVSAACSVDIGCVRLTERSLPSDPPTAQEIEAASALIDSLVAPGGRDRTATEMQRRWWLSPAPPRPSQRWHWACTATTRWRSTPRCWRRSRCTRWPTSCWR